ncbi:MAG: hypothetical protein A3F09_04670 [Chlamydiae bacterium RIFCSPHIGHO2_12_FULL_49_11]|nr:MAG: hypothetical protein A3F09_04670 [Chlamydiae bacterium RIFCSPHIGHO2_12_FULL_49_11]
MGQFFQNAAASFVLFSHLLCADTVVLQIDAGGYTLFAPPKASFNPQVEEYILSWSSGAGISATLVNKDGVRIKGPNVIVASGIPNSPPAVCYNSKDNAFLVSYGGNSGGGCAAFNILDGTGTSIIGPLFLPNAGGDVACGPVACCYNACDNTYVLAWGSAKMNGYFAVVDAAGHLVIPPTAEANCIIDVIAGFTMDVSYNSTENRYLFSWQDKGDGLPHFAVYNADGTVHIGSTAISSKNTPNAMVVPGCYNSRDNQYFFAWNDDATNGYFASYDAGGSVVLSSRQFADTVSGVNFGSINSSYNPVMNAYFLSWEDINGNVQFAGFGAAGNVVKSTTEVRNINGNMTYGSVPNSIDTVANSLLMSWFSLTGLGFYVISTL